MRICLTTACIFLASGVAVYRADAPSRTSRDVELAGPAVRAILREAVEILLKQDEHERRWRDSVLPPISDVQTRAGDFDGATRTLLASEYVPGRNYHLVRLAAEIARRGNRQRAFDTLKLINANYGWPQDRREDAVQLCWVEHLIASDDLARARDAVGQLKTTDSRINGLRKLAVAYARARDADRSAEQFSLALAAASSKDEYDLARSLCATADAQLSVRQTGAAKETIRLLAEKVEWKHPETNFYALREAAVLASRANDRQTARHLFDRAMKARKAVDGEKRVDALGQLAVSEAGAGFVDEALKTAWMIERSEVDLTRDADRERALYAVAKAQAEAGDVEGALRTALSIDHFLQYRDDSVHAVVDHLIAKRNLKAALSAADKCHNPSRKAAAVLKVAAAYVKSGDRKTAEDAAKQITLRPSRSTGLGGDEVFDYRQPQTWAVNYDFDGVFTNGIYMMQSGHMSEVAGAAMRLAQALHLRPERSYAILFDDIRMTEVIWTLARTHAASGDPDEALAWARQIGSHGVIKSKDDDETRRAVERRIAALVGVAEGILDRAGVSELPEP